MRKHGRPSVALALVCTRFFANSALIIDFKGVSMKLKIVALAIFVEQLILIIFWTFYC